MEKSPANQPGSRPDIRQYGDDLPAFVADMRQWLGLTYQEVEDRSQRGVRGKHRKRSINFWYRLEKGKAKLKPQIVDALAAAFDLTPAENEYLLEATTIQQHGGSKEDRKRRGRVLMRMLRGDETLDEDHLTAVRSLLNPVVLALYGLMQRMNVPFKNNGKYLARHMTTKSVDPQEIEEHLRMLLDNGLIQLDTRSQTLQQTERGKGIHASAISELPGSAKSEAMKLFFASLDDWGAEALFTTPARYRNFESLTVLTDEHRLEKLNLKIRQFWSDVCHEIENEVENPDGDIVIHVGVRSWPMVSLNKLERGDH